MAVLPPGPAGTLNEATPFEVTGTGQKELAYYINGEARGTIPVNFDESPGGTG